MVSLVDTRRSARRAPQRASEFDAETKSFVPVSDERSLEIGRRISPLYHETSDDAPTLIIHGDADEVVPFEQSERIIQAFRMFHLPAEVEWRRRRRGRAIRRKFENLSGS